MLNIILSFAQYEREMIWERTQEGKVAARQKEGYKEGRKEKRPIKFSEYYEKWERGEISVSSACSELGIGRTTWYKLAKEIGA